MALAVRTSPETDEAAAWLGGEVRSALEALAASGPGSAPDPLELRRTRSLVRAAELCGGAGLQLGPGVPGAPGLSLARTAIAVRSGTPYMWPLHAHVREPLRRMGALRSTTVLNLMRPAKPLPADWPEGLTGLRRIVGEELVRLGNDLHMSGDHAGAASSFAAARVLMPDASAPARNLGISLYRFAWTSHEGGNEPRALEAFRCGAEALKRAAELGPADPEPHLWAGLVAEEGLDDPDAALGHYRRYLDLGGAEVDKVREWISKLEEGEGGR